MNKDGHFLLATLLWQLFGFGSPPASQDASPEQVTPEMVTQANVHYAKGKEFEAQGNYYSACPEFSEAVRLNPRFGKAYLCVGICDSRALKREKAIQDYKKALAGDIDPANAAIAHYNLGSEYLAERQLELASNEFNATLALN